jgi:hypothetical protein
MISKLKCHCGQGTCEWVGELQVRDSHRVNSCEYTEVSCGNQGCDVKMLRGELALHMETTCAHRVETCPHCSSIIKSVDLMVHFSVCDGMSIQCPNNCGESVVRRDSVQHESKCPMALIACPIVRYGCTCVQVRRKDLPGHHTSPDNGHYELMMDEILKLEAKCEKQAKAYAKQAEVCELQDERMKELVTENNLLMNTLCEKEDEISALKQSKQQVSTTSSTASG